MGYAGLRMTAEEFAALGETAERYELIDGIVSMSPSPTPRHQLFVVELLAQFLRWRAANPGATILPDVDLRLSRGQVYRPDVLVYAPGRLVSLPERLVTPPDLVVEILSPGSKPLDLITKRDDYDRFGVGEYWVIDPVEGTARAWQRRAGEPGAQMLEIGVMRDAVRSSSLAGFTLDLSPLRAAAGD